MLNNQFWNEYTLRYDDAIASMRPYRDLIDQCVEWAAPQPGQVIADIGCGTGNLLAELARNGSAPAELIGIERSGVARALAGRKLARDPRARLLALDIEQPRWSAGLAPIDTACVVNVLYDLRDPLCFLAELRERLRVGGRLILSNPHTPKPIALVEAHARWREQAPPKQRLADDAHLPARAWMLEINTEIVRYARRRKVHFLGLTSMVELLNAAGFLVTRIDANAYAGLNLLVAAERIG